jgi:hypothetical protein
MEAKGSSQSSGLLHKATRRHIPQDRNFHSRRRDVRQQCLSYLKLEKDEKAGRRRDMDSFSNKFDTYILLYTGWQMDGVTLRRQRPLQRRNNRPFEHPATL